MVQSRTTHPGSENVLTDKQNTLLEACHNDNIQAQAANMEKRVIYILERQFNTLIREVNQAYTVFQKSKEKGVQYIENNLLPLTQTANQFSIEVY